MSKRTWIDGNTYRDTNSDGSMSSVHRVNSRNFGGDETLSIEKHNADGTTTPYVRDNSLLGALTLGSGWKKK